VQPVHQVTQPNTAVQQAQAAQQRAQQAQAAQQPQQTFQQQAQHAAAYQQTYEDSVAQTADQIGNAIGRITGAENNTRAHAPAHEYDDYAEPTKIISFRSDDDELTPRPKFDFDNLKFGDKFTDED
jgi:type II secretory pathway pseudopilin PulG